MELKGKYGTATVHTDLIESSAISQIITLLNQPMADGAHVRIMPDVHAGAGCVIGYTARVTGKIVPNLIGVDIGCGVVSYKLGNTAFIGEKFDKLDKFIRNNIPSGRSIRDEKFDLNVMGNIYSRLPGKNAGFTDFIAEVERVVKSTGQSRDYVWNSLGTLGGGNHFIEIDKDGNDLWLTIHCGSRNFGLKVAKFHQDIAKKSIRQSWTTDEIQAIIGKYKGKKRKEERRRIQQEIEELKSKGPVKVPTSLEYLEGDAAKAYLKDMNVAQIYASLNRAIIGYLIIKKFYKLDYFQIAKIESVHNYISFEDNIIRKGAISAHDSEAVIIPLNMADGVIVGYGKGDDEWNFSAPHGAGRTMSRSKAKQSISLDSFKKLMKAKGVWTSTADKHTLDEAPQAYKKAEHIIQYLEDTVDIEVQMKPVYNYKASE